MEPREKSAVELTRRGWSANKIAQKLGVNRSTVSRWKQTQEFQEALAAAPSNPEVGEMAREGLARLVPDALDLLETALKSDISAAKMNSALAIIREAAALAPGGKDGGDSSLKARLMELEQRAVVSD